MGLTKLLKEMKKRGCKKEEELNKHKIGKKNEKEERLTQRVFKGNS